MHVEVERTFVDGHLVVLLLGADIGRLYSKIRHLVDGIYSMDLESLILWETRRLYTICRRTFYTRVNKSA